MFAFSQTLNQMCKLVYTYANFFVNKFKIVDI